MYKQEVMQSLVSICVDYVLKHINLYYDNFMYLPAHMKDRILNRISSVRVPNDNITEIYKMLVHSSLKKIDFTLYDSNDDMLNVLRGCKDIRELILTRYENEALTEQALLDVIPNFDKLIVLQAENCRAVTDNVVKKIVLNCPLLSEIDLAGCTSISDLTLEELSKLTNLRALNISRTNVTNSGFIYLTGGPSCALIKELRLSECKLIDHVAINLICEKCTALEILIFNNSSNDHSQVNFEDSNFTKLKQLTWTVYW